MTQGRGVVEKEHCCSNITYHCLRCRCSRFYALYPHSRIHPVHAQSSTYVYTYVFTPNPSPNPNSSYCILFSLTNQNSCIVVRLLSFFVSSFPSVPFVRFCLGLLFFPNLSWFVVCSIFLISLFSLRVLLASSGLCCCNLRRRITCLSIIGCQNGNSDGFTGWLSAQKGRFNVTTQTQSHKYTHTRSKHTNTHTLTHTYCTNNLAI